MKLKQDKAKEIKLKYRLNYIAKEVGISKQFISYLFNDKKTCSMDTAMKIVNIVYPNASIDEYFEK